MQRYSSAFICLLISFNLSSVSLAQISSKKTIAVIDLDTRGAVTQAEAGTLTDRLRSRLVLTGVFNVVERGKMEAILKEVGFQQTGCTSTECAVEVGRILNVQEIVAGSVGKIGAIYTIDVALIDVETSRLAKPFTTEYKGPIEGLLVIMEEIAAELARTLPAQATAKKTIPKKDDSSVTQTSPSNRQAPPEKSIVQNPSKVKDETPKKPVAKTSVKKSNKTGLWIAGSVIVAGGAVAVIMLQGNNGTKPNEQIPDLPTADDLPWPPRD